MALIRCRECDQEISSKAKTCPNCGAPNKKPTSVVTKFLAYFLVIFFILLLLSLLFGNGTQSTFTPRSTSSLPKPTIVTEDVLDEVRLYISEGRYGSAIATAEKYELSKNPELTQLHNDATEMLAARKQETADKIAADQAAAVVRLQEIADRQAADQATAVARAREDAIKSTDDFQIHKDAFLRATATLVGNGTCTLVDLREMGGWVRSQTHKPKSVYFTYCGGMTVNNRIYLDANSGRIFR